MNMARNMRKTLFYALVHIFPQRCQRRQLLYIHGLREGNSQDPRANKYPSGEY